MISISPSGQSNPAEGKGVEPSSQQCGNCLSRAARPTVSGYLPYFSGPPGSRTPISCLQGRCLPLGPAARLIHQEVRPGIEPGLPPYREGVLPKHLQTNQVIPDQRSASVPDSNHRCL